MLFATEIIKLLRFFIFGYNFASTDVRSETEAWAYPIISFIADMGGALSLFVGVSFLSFWDCSRHIIRTTVRKYKELKNGK